ncbi:UAA transporter family protein [Nitzschia inconspicua]|uniref:UAA transporter family protein n=1 Tax=Nitzschia inconspicua TaxID=303405 RepID=A0A9K3LGJ1_9STRA|nr:UAA transporter family protein [Nitzschia inconspicua]
MARRKQERMMVISDDADVAAGVSGLSLPHPPPPPPPMSRGAMSTATSCSDIEFYEDLISEPVLVLGFDVSHMSRNAQFVVCASGVYFFSLLYGYLQELLSVQLCSRQLGLYLAMIQFIGYTFLAYLLNDYVYKKQSRRTMKSSSTPRVKNGNHGSILPTASLTSKLAVPFTLYLGLSLLRAVDLAMTNLAMQFINYPAKTLMKSSRIVFTMIFGVFITHKRYQLADYAIVLCMVVGLAIFMHADATSSAVFQPLGVIMLTISLLCDGAIVNMSENIMTQYGVGQDEFIFRMYSIALVAIIGAATVKGDLTAGLVWMLQPGTYDEQLNNVPLEERTWSAGGKMAVMILFSSMGFFGSSCAAAITKQFGALAMSITSTARKATTLFLSFLLFDNACTYQHVLGIIIFIASLTAKSFRRKQKSRGNSTMDAKTAQKMLADLEGGRSMVVVSTASASFALENGGDNNEDGLIGVPERQTSGGAERRKNAYHHHTSTLNNPHSSVTTSQRGQYNVV